MAQRKKKSVRFQNFRNSDKLLLLLVVVLMIFGILMISSSTYITGQMYYKVGPYYFALFQLGGVIGSLVIIFLLTNFLKPKLLFTMATIGLIGTSFLLVMLYFVGQIAGGAQSVINIGSFAFQPLELAKISTIIFMAA